MYRLSYYPWITQNVPPDQVAAQVRIFAHEIESQLKKLGQANAEVQVLPAVEVPKQIEQIVTGGAEIALMNPLGFVFARNRTDNVEAVAVAIRIINGAPGKFYFSQLYTHKKTAIRDLKQAAGRSIGYGLPYSTSNFLMAAFVLLEKAGIHPFCGFGRIEFLKGHEKIAVAVYEGRVEVGAGHDGVIKDLATQPGYGDAEDVLVRLDRSEPIPSDPVVVRIADAKEREQVKQAIIDAGNTPAGIEALKIFWGKTQRLEGTDSGFYKDLGEALKKLRLEQNDLLPPA